MLAGVHGGEAVEEVGEELFFAGDDAGEFPDVRALLRVVDLLEE